MDFLISGLIWGLSEMLFPNKKQTVTSNKNQRDEFGYFIFSNEERGCHQEDNDDYSNFDYDVDGPDW